MWEDTITTEISQISSESNISITQKAREPKKKSPLWRAK